MYSRKIPKNLLKIDSIKGPSCKDLNGCDCEGWLWFKKNKNYVERWCVLRSNKLRLLVNPKVEDFELEIQILDSSISPMKKSKSKNFYFKICYEENVLIFGTESKSDYWKWLNKLKLSCADIHIDESDGTVGGFTSGYILESQNLIKYSHTLSKSNSTPEYFNIDPSNKSTNTSVSEEPISPSDKRIELSYVRSLSESENAYNNLSCHPTVPPRKYSYRNNKKVENKNLQHSTSESVTETEKSKIEMSVNSFFTPSPLNQVTEEYEKNLSPKSSNPSINKSNNSQNDIESERNSQWSNESKKKNEELNGKGTESKMNSIRKVVELERLIRDKQTMVVKIDEALKSHHMHNNIHGFWDEHGQDILKIIGKQSPQ